MERRVVRVSRVTILEKMYAKSQKSALEFDYDSLWAPPIRSLLTYEDINELYSIATSVRLSGSVNKKYQLLDAVMERRGFRPDHKGTNRVTYRFLEDPRFIAKVAVDSVGIKDSPAEYKNQEFLKPFCCKIFEVDPTGVIAFVERVNPITSLQEFASVSDDIFNMMVTKIIGKYVVDDLGTTKFMNYGIRMRNGCNFGPVVIDFPYVYELDGAKLVCNGTIKGTNLICNGEIDYDAGLNNLVCKKCGRQYSAKQLKKDDSIVLKYYGESDRRYTMRARVVNSKGEVIMDTGRSSKRPLSEDELKEVNSFVKFEPVTKVAKTHVTKRNKRQSPLDVNRQFQRKRLADYEKMMEAQKAGPFNPVIKPNSVKVSTISDSAKAPKMEEEEAPAKPIRPTVTSVPVSVIHCNEEAIRLAIPELNNEPTEEDFQEAQVLPPESKFVIENPPEPPKQEEEPPVEAEPAPVDDIEPDYSNYEPKEEEVDYYQDDKDEYQEYADKFEREDRRLNKRRNNRVDMSEY